MSMSNQTYEEEVIDDIEEKCKNALLVQFANCKTKHSDKILYWKDIHLKKCQDEYLTDLQLCYSYYKKNYKNLSERQQVIDSYNLMYTIKNKDTNVYY
jgi:hypothetical protein